MREPFLLGAVSWVVLGGAAWLLLSIVAWMFVWAATRRTKHFEKHHDELVVDLRESNAVSAEEPTERSAAI